MKTNLLSKTDTASMIDRIGEQWTGIDLPRARNARVYCLDQARLVEIGGALVLDVGGTFLPFLGNTEMLARFPSVTVDMGAVKFMCNGANVMRPGIRECAEFVQGQIVAVVEESQRKFLAVGRAVVSSSKVKGMKRGEVVKNMHYISDKYWECAKEINSRAFL